MDNLVKYKVTDKVSFVIANDFRLLQVMSRFGISLGFGDKNIQDICRECDVDPHTFITVINFVKSGGGRLILTNPNWTSNPYLIILSVHINIF